jgi:chromosome segregation ATPase
MNKPPWLSKIMMPAIALVAGLMIGLTFGHIQVRKERNIAQDKVKEANKKVSFMQKKMSEERDRAAGSLEQQCQADMDRLLGEKQAVGAELKKTAQQAHMLEQKARESDGALAKAKTELQEMDRHNRNLEGELKKVAGEKQALQAELKKTEGERQDVQGDLKKTAQELGHCRTNNADLVAIAEELVDKYRNKGVGAALLAKEPLTQIRKVEFERISQQYRTEIEQKKINKK